MSGKFQGIVVVAACLLGGHSAGAAAFYHLGRQMDGNLDFIEKVADDDGCPFRRCGGSTLVPWARNVGDFVKNQHDRQWLGTESDFVAVSKQAPSIAVTPEAAKVHVDKVAPLL